VKNILSLLFASSIITTLGHAQDLPLDFPTKDVVIEQRVSAGVTPILQSVRYLASELKMRVETKDQPGYGIVDLKAHVLLTVVPGSPASYVVQPLGEADRQADRRGYKKIGTDVVLGLQCVVWQTPYTKMNGPGSAQSTTSNAYLLRTTNCITLDGVPLRTVMDSQFEGKDWHSSVEVLNVRYEKQNSALFRLPVGAIRIETTYK
jgi:hypothetical protein